MSVDVHKLLAEPEPEHDWIVEGHLDRGDRAIITGYEGHGKSTLIRQYGVQVAAGITPFALDRIPAKRVLLIDFENSRRQVRDHLRPLAEVAGERLLEDQLFVEVRPEGVDLRQQTDRNWLYGQLQDTAPDLVLLGPLYKMNSGDPGQEEVANVLAAQLDYLRTHFACALIIEAHCPHASAGNPRVNRPYGASLWMRWPEFGMFLAKDGAVTNWRNPREERDWPTKMHRGNPWPWEMEPAKVTFAHLIALVETLGYLPSTREVEKELGCSRNTASRLINANRDEWDKLLK
jgi:replicative DNA helicase